MDSTSAQPKKRPMSSPRTVAPGADDSDCLGYVREQPGEQRRDPKREDGRPTRTRSFEP
jgi:hypothetical protein